MLHSLWNLKAVALAGVGFAFLVYTSVTAKADPYTDAYDAICAKDIAKWTVAHNAMRNSIPFYQSDPADFPQWNQPLKCPRPAGKKAAHNTRVAPSTAQQYVPGTPGSVYNTEAGFYLQGEVGGASSCDFQTFTSIITLGGADAFNPSTRQACGGQFLGGGTIGVNISHSEYPLTSPSQTAAVLAGLALQATFLGGAGSTTLTGTPTTALGPLPGTDQYKTHDNFIALFDATATMSLNPSMAVEVRAGLGIDDKTATYYCNGLCTLGGVPMFSQSHTAWLAGPTAGASLLFPIAGTPAEGTLNFDYVDLERHNFQFGMPSTINPAFNLGQGIFIFTAGARVPFANLSDAWLKRDIVPVHRLTNGLNLYRFRYLWSDQLYVGVIAQEVSNVVPDAVMRGRDGYLRVNYERLGLKLQTWDEWLTSSADQSQRLN